jgi:hypothetical protein
MNGLKCLDLLGLAAAPKQDPAFRKVKKYG